MIETSKEKTILFFAAGGIAVILGVYAFFYRPLASKLSAARLECGIAEGKAAEARRAGKLLKESGQGLGFLPEEKISFAVDELTKRGKKEKINFLSITPGEIKAVAGGAAYRILPISLEVESNYESLGRFLGSLDKLSKSLVTLNSFHVILEKKHTGLLRANLELNIYLAGNG